MSVSVPASGCESAPVFACVCVIKKKDAVPTARVRCLCSATGEKLAQDDGVVLLQAYSVYVLCMALNGITECFVAAVRVIAARPCLRVVVSLFYLFYLFS